MTLLCLGLAACTGAVLERAAEQPGGFVVRRLTVHHQPCRYAVYVPPQYDPRRSWPCILFLHGSGECGDDGTKPTQVGLGPTILAHPERWPFVVVMPQKPAQDEEWEEREDLVLQSLRAVRAAYRIDPDQVALVGMSQGGHGAWMIAARHPQIWSCLVPVCGYVRARTVAPRVAHLPVWAFHGLQDDVVDPGDTQQIVEGIRQKQAREGLLPGNLRQGDRRAARMTLYPDLNHGCWDAAFGEEELPAWILAQTRRR
jgi:predicted peptidase